MADQDYYPSSMDARDVFHANLAAQIPALATKYDIDPTDVSRIQKDALWMTGWVQARHEFDNLSQQMTKYFNGIAGNNPDLPAPAPLNIVLTGTTPDEVPPGIEFRTRVIVRQIKNHKDYSVADGELLGIVAPESTEKDLAELTPEFTVKTLANFQVEITFRKYGMDALKVQFRYKGGDWQPAGFLTMSGVISLVPATAGTAQQLELRAVYVLKNEDTGNYTDAKPAFIAP